MNIKVIGIDLAKNSFQICVLGTDNKVISNKSVSRAKLVSSVQKFSTDVLIAMEACGSSHYWARHFESLGYQVKLLPAQGVKNYVGHQKNDANDAIAICEAAFSPKIHAVKIKTRAQQDLKLLVNLRNRSVQQRTQLINRVRAIASEYGEIFPKGKTALLRVLDVKLEKSSLLSEIAKEVIQVLQQEIIALNIKIKALDKRIEKTAKQEDAYERIRTIPGVGPVTAATVIADIGDAKSFKNGRQLSAWCGLVPKQHSTGGKTKLSNITKNGNRALRTLLIHCARSIYKLRNKHVNKLNRWVNAVADRRQPARAIVALANKLLRIIWRILTSNEKFDMNKAFNHAVH